MNQRSMRFDQDEILTPSPPPLPRPHVADEAEAILPRDTHVIAPSEIRRLSGQSAAILARLQAGPATRRELADICLNPTARVSDLRAAGYTIVVEEHQSGKSIYHLVIE